MQHLLARATWSADAIRDDLCDYVVDAFGDPGAVLIIDETGAVLIIDETGDVMKGTATVGVQRQYSGNGKPFSATPFIPQKHALTCVGLTGFEPATT